MAIRTVRLKAGLDTAYPETSASLTKTSRGNVADDLDNLFAKANLYKGRFETELALETAYPTADAGSYATVEATDTFWVWDNDLEEWKDSFNQAAPVTSVNGKDGAVVLGGGDINSTINVDGEESTQTLTQHLQAHQTDLEAMGVKTITLEELDTAIDVDDEGIYKIKIGDFYKLVKIFHYQTNTYQIIYNSYFQSGQFQNEENLTYNCVRNTYQGSWQDWGNYGCISPKGITGGLGSDTDTFGPIKSQDLYVKVDNTTIGINTSNQLEVKPFVENLPVSNKENYFLNANLQFAEVSSGGSGIEEKTTAEDITLLDYGKLVKTLDDGVIYNVDKVVSVEETIPFSQNLVGQNLVNIYNDNITYINTSVLEQEIQQYTHLADYEQTYLSQFYIVFNNNNNPNEGNIILVLEKKPTDFRIFIRFTYNGYEETIYEDGVWTKAEINPTDLTSGSPLNYFVINQIFTSPECYYFKAGENSETPLLKDISNKGYTIINNTSVTNPISIFTLDEGDYIINGYFNFKGPEHYNTGNFENIKINVKEITVDNPDILNMKIVEIPNYTFSPDSIPNRLYYSTGVRTTIVGTTFSFSSVPYENVQTVQYDEANYARGNQVIRKGTGEPFTPVLETDPTNKKYVDDTVGLVNTVETIDEYTIEKIVRNNDRLKYIDFSTSNVIEAPVLETYYDYFNFDTSVDLTTFDYSAYLYSGFILCNGYNYTNDYDFSVYLVIEDLGSGPEPLIRVSTAIGEFIVYQHGSWVNTRFNPFETTFRFTHIFDYSSLPFIVANMSTIRGERIIRIPVEKQLSYAPNLISKTISTTDWVGTTATISVEEVTGDADQLVEIIPEKTRANYLLYMNHLISNTVQGVGELTFECSTVPASDVNVIIKITNKVEV